MASMASRWHNCVQYDRPEIWTSNLLFNNLQLQIFKQRVLSILDACVADNLVLVVVTGQVVFFREEVSIVDVAMESEIR